jgi:hypothetical protein
MNPSSLADPPELVLLERISLFLQRGREDNRNEAAGTLATPCRR